MKNLNIGNSILQRTISLLFVSCAASGLVSCGKTSPRDSNDKKNNEGTTRDPLYGGYWLTYSAENESLRTFAQFRKGSSKGEPQKLAVDSIVKINGKEMQLQTGDKEFSNMSGENYEFSEAVGSALNPEYVYEVKNADGSITVNKVKMASALEVDEDGWNENKTISRKDGIQAVFKGSLNAENESIVCRLVSLEKAGLVMPSGELTEKLNKINSCIFSAKSLASLPLGKAEIKMIRTWTVEAANGHTEAGGFLQSDYISKPVLLNITE